MRPVEMFVRRRRPQHHMPALPRDRQPAPIHGHKPTDAEPGARAHHHHRRGRMGVGRSIVEPQDILRPEERQRQGKRLEVVEEQTLIQAKRRGKLVAIDGQPAVGDGRVRELRLFAGGRPGHREKHRSRPRKSSRRDGSLRRPGEIGLAGRVEPQHGRQRCVAFRQDGEARVRAADIGHKAGKGSRERRSAHPALT